MSAVGTCARVTLRRSRSWLSLVLVVGLAGGAVLACLAGGRRTDSAYARFARDHLAADFVVFPSFRPGARSNFDRIAQLPTVRVAETLQGYSTDGPIAAARTGSYGQVINRPKLVSGRLPRPDHPDEVAITDAVAQSRHLAVGDRLVVNFFGQPRRVGSAPSVLPVRVRVVGIEVSPGDFPPALQATFSLQMILSSAFVSTFGPRLGPPLTVLVVRLRHGDADAPAFQAGLRRLSGAQPQQNARLSQQAANVQRGFHLQAVALWLLAGLLAVAVTLVLYQLLARHSLLGAEDHLTLRALGMTRPQMWLSLLAPAVVIGSVGAALAMGVAFAISPVLPIGTARLAEPHPGFAADWFVVGVGALSIALIVTAIALWPTWRAASQGLTVPTDPREARPTLLDRITPATVSPAAAVGIGMALRPGAGRSAVPVRSSLAGVTLAVVALTAAMTFGSSLTHLTGTPQLYGWNWDAHVFSLSNHTAPAALAAFSRTLTADPRIGAVAILDSPPLVVGNSSVTGVSLDSMKGHVSPVVLNGRAPQSSNEVALGAKTMRDLNAHIGSVVPVSISATRLLRAPKRVVGTVVLPPQNDAGRFGVGAMLTHDGFLTLIPTGVSPPPPTEAVFRFRSGVDRTRALTDVRRTLGVQWAVYEPTPPTDLVNFGHVQNLPVVLAGLLALLAIATLAHTLASSVFRRARNLAVLKTLGFVRAQIWRAVIWQSTTMAGIAMVVGVPLGVVSGRVLWDVFASQLGTRPEAVTPLTVLVVVPAAMVVATLVAAPPALLAARTRPAQVLRAE
jgi:hypothetical protein